VRKKGPRGGGDGSVLLDKDKKNYVTGEETTIFRFSDDGDD
jgi:hypothetical protein